MERPRKIKRMKFQRTRLHDTLVDRRTLIQTLRELPLEKAVEFVDNRPDLFVWHTERFVGFVETFDGERLASVNFLRVHWRGDKSRQPVSMLHYSRMLR